ncbi:MAG: amidohydrolase [Deltaproteobacteria bacterium]|nr:MAG: amidohydrolase [Deltaproteobacteria bacterium]
MAERLISADSHVNPPPDLWVRDAPRHLADRVPRVESTPEGDVWVVDRKTQPVQGLSFMGGRDYKDYRPRVVYKEMRPGSWDPQARLADMDQDGIAVDVLYGGGPMRYDDPELRRWCIARYNDWLFELERASGGRLVGIPVIPIDSLDEALAELRRVLAKGARGVQVEAFPDNQGRPHYSDPVWEPLWSEIAAAEVPLSFHIQGPRGMHLQRLFDPTPGVRESFIALAPLGVSELVAELVFCGICARHPRLRFVVVETGIGWIPYFLERMDSTFKKHRFWTRSVIPEPPSFYWYRQGHATFIEDRAGVKLHREAGVENVMWSSDYPHSDSTWPRSPEVVAEHFAGVPDEARRQIIYGNAARLYRIS